MVRTMDKRRFWLLGGLSLAMVMGAVGFGCDSKSAPQQSGSTKPPMDRDGEEYKDKSVRPASPVAASAAAESAGPGRQGTVGFGSGGGGATERGRHPGIAAPVSMPVARQDDMAVAKLDPNARYATTYRPGGAALAAFDAALAKGSIPSSYKDLVGDFGGRFAPSIGVPTGEAMAFQIDTERSALPQTGGPIHLRIAMRSSEATPSRAPLAVSLVLDVSGSMSGLAIEHARSAAEALVKRLDDKDDFSMVTFSSDAKVLVPSGAIGPRRATAIEAIKAVRAEGGTNISAGLDLAYQQARSPKIAEDAVRLVMLLSDGHANAGDTNATSLGERASKAFQDGIQTSSFGLGADFDAPLMSGIADRGAGGYYYLADSNQIAPALAREFDARLVPVAQAVEVRVRLRPDVNATKVYGSRQLTSAEAMRVRQQEVSTDKNVEVRDGIRADRQKDAEGGMRFFMPAFARADRHAMLLTLNVPAGTAERNIASVEIKYKDRITKKNVTKEIPVKVSFAADAETSAKTESPSVLRTIQAFAAGDTIVQAVTAVDRGDRTRAHALLSERAELLTRASDTLSDPSLKEEASRLLKLAEAVSGANRIQDPLPLAVLLRGSSYAYLR